MPAGTAAPLTHPGVWRPTAAGISDGMDSEKTEAVQAVVDRVGSYQEGAPEGTVGKELREALDEAGLEVADGDVTKIAEAIDARDGIIDVAEVLG